VPPRSVGTTLNQQALTNAATVRINLPFALQVAAVYGKYDFEVKAESTGDHDRGTCGNHCWERGWGDSAGDSHGRWWGFAAPCVHVEGR
ncbi:MAG: hypothetical protein HZA46_03705, partial [Planctomycetales bacterium]|nr:hypothetical protein [Planctomycetales bacterium]